MKQRAAKESRSSPPTSESTEKPEAVQFLPPLKPRPVLFWVLSGVMAVWVALLVVMYFTTVRPQLHGQGPAPARAQVPE
jgi:hypothetical protein